MEINEAMNAGAFRRLGLRGDVALVTGANRGIGRAVAMELCALGATVMVASRDEAGGRRVVEEITDRGGSAGYVAFDAFDAEGTCGVVDAVVRQFGRLSILVNNAGIFPETAMADATAEQWDEVFAVNARSTFLLLRDCAEWMVQSGTAGRIVNISSMGSIRPAAPSRFAYNASKAAMNRLTIDAAAQYARHGIRVNAVLPGPTLSATPSTQGASDDLHAAIARRIPLGRYGSVEEIAAVVAFLAAPASSFVTGHLLVADGGFTIR